MMKLVRVVEDVVHSVEHQLEVCTGCGLNCGDLLIHEIEEPGDPLVVLV